MPSRFRNHSGYRKVGEGNRLRVPWDIFLQVLRETLMPHRFFQHFANNSNDPLPNVEVLQAGVWLFHRPV